MVCVNDASLDASGEILTEYARKYSQIKVFNRAEKSELSAEKYRVKARNIKKNLIDMGIKEDRMVI